MNVVVKVKTEIPDPEDGVATSIRPLLQKYKQSGAASTNSSTNDNTAEQADNPNVKSKNDGKTGTDEQLPNGSHVSSLENHEAVNESTESGISAGTGNQVPHITCEISPDNGENANEISTEPTKNNVIVNENYPEQNSFRDKSNENNTSAVVTIPIIKQEPELTGHINMVVENKDDEQEEGEIMSTDEEQELATDIPLEKDSQTLPTTSTMRLRVKSEFSNSFSSYNSTPYHALSLPPLPTSTCPSLPPEPHTDPTNIVNHIKDGFFDDLLEQTVTKKNDKDDTNDNNELENVNNDDYSNGAHVIESYQRIPEDFFDEFLPPNNATTSSGIVYEPKQEQEIKYSKYLQNSQNELTYMEDGETKWMENHQKSRKRNYDNDQNDNENDNAYYTRKRYCAFEAENEMDLNHCGTTSRLSRDNVIREPSNNDLPISSIERQSFAFKPLKLVKLENRVVATAPKEDNTEENDLSCLTPKEKGERAVQRVLETLKICEQHSNNQKPSPIDKNGFLITCTIGKLPSSECNLYQKYGNCSLLHNKSNVNYKFNSFTWTPNNLRSNGLEVLSPTTTRLARLLCYDVYALKDKLKNIKLPAKLQNIRNTMQEQQQLEEKRLQSSSTYFKSTTTQTEDGDFKSLGVDAGLGDRDRDRDHNHDGANAERVDIGIQVRPKVGTVGVQTTSLEQNTDLNDLPIITLLRKLNDNELMGLHDYAELLLEPIKTSSSMDMYRLRQRLLDIYKASKMPSTTEPQTEYSSITTNTSQSSLHKSYENLYHDNEERNRYSNLSNVDHDNTHDKSISSQGRTADVNDVYETYDNPCQNNINRKPFIPKQNHEPVRTSSSSSTDPRYLSSRGKRNNRYDKRSLSPNSPSASTSSHQISKPKFYGRGGKRRQT